MREDSLAAGHIQAESESKKFAILFRHTSNSFELLNFFTRSSAAIDIYLNGFGSVRNWKWPLEANPLTLFSI
ncbi:MAG: hypothetical protein C5B55_10660 [Blastocatellia bacterium]|nr:MAG: hypothetical protein C5B55_10660 [Blastocatellia bacterium]